MWAGFLFVERNSEYSASNAQNINCAPILGGDSSDNWQFNQTYQYCDDEVVSDGVAWALFSGQMQLAYAVNHGCVPLGTERLVTRAADNTIYEIDGKPAWQVLEEYLSAEELTNWENVLVSFPLGFEAPGYMQDQETYTIRALIGGLDKETGAVTLASEVAEGSHVWMTRRDYDKISIGIEQIATEIKQ